MIAHILYGWLVAVGLIDLFLVAPALRRAIQEESVAVGRLISTLPVLAGLVLGCYGRLLQSGDNIPLITLIGAGMIDVGLVGYALFFPETGILGLIKRWRQR